jgi:hypothetical protein
MTEYRCTWWEITDKPVVWDGHIGKPVYRNIDTGEETHELPIGALFVYANPGRGHDGLSVACVVPYSEPGHTDDRLQWHIDGFASNCTKPEDATHRCWVRHGTIGETVHVDKSGNTCAAGGGSIQVPGFHGFLHHGVLWDC